MLAVRRAVPGSAPRLAVPNAFLLPLDTSRVFEAAERHKSFKEAGDDSTGVRLCRTMQTFGALHKQEVGFSQRLWRRLRQC